MDGDRHHFELGAGEQHHRMQLFPVGRGEGGEIFRVSGKGEARAIEHGLGDRIGHDGACRALLHESSRRARSTVCTAGTAAWSGWPATTLPATVIGSTGRASAKDARRFALRRQARRSARRAQLPGARGKDISIAEQDERRNCLALSRLPGGSVMSGPIPAGSPRVSARGRSARSMALRLARNARTLTIFDEGLLPEIAQQPLGADLHFRLHQFALSLLSGCRRRP